MRKKETSDINLLKNNYNNWWQNKRETWPETDVMGLREKKNHRKICRYLGKLEEGKLLDVCCGIGGFLSYLEESSNLTLYGIDISSVAISKAKQRLRKSKISVGDAQDMPFEDNYFDYVSCLGSLEHLPDPTKGAKEISRVLKPSGKALILVPNLYFLGHIYMAIMRGTYPSEGQQQFSEMFSTIEGWKDLLNKGNVEVVNFYKYNDIWATKKVNKLLITLWNIAKSFMPMGLSYAFIFICKKKRKL